jgi:IS30 family transposase
MARRLSLTEQIQIRRLNKRGLSVTETAVEMGRSWWGTKLALHALPAPEPEEWDPGPGRLCCVEREEIRAGLIRGETFTLIAQTIGRATSTVSREVATGGGRQAYRAVAAHDRAKACARCPKAPKLSCPGPLVDQVEAWLIELWSPEEIAKRLRLEFGDDPMMQVSHETIYKSLFVQGRGSLRKELTACLRTGRAVRRPQGRIERRGKLVDMVMISERPAEVEDRAVPGHWEGDLIIGKAGKSAVGTLVERSTRYALLLHLPEGHTAEAVRLAMDKAIGRLPSQMFKTVTWDQGKEMARHASFTVDKGIQIYFCDPHSPWQRGSNENTNGLLRQFMPRGPISTSTAPPISLRSSASSTGGPEKPWVGSSHVRSSRSCLR